MLDSNPACTENLSDLIALQVRFGLAYVQEARSAYHQGRHDYADLARQIAVNAYSTVTRFAARLPDEGHPVLSNEMTRLKDEVEALHQETVAVPSIA